MALAAACAAFSVVADLLQWSALPQAGLFPVAIVAFTLALNIIPHEAATPASFDSPWWDLPSRMALIAGLVVSVTLIAPYIGPKTSGVIASFPFMAMILAVFAHRMIGHAAARQVMRGMVTGLLGFATFFYVLSVALTRLNLLVAYAGAILCALAIQTITLYRMRLPVIVSTEQA